MSPRAEAGNACWYMLLMASCMVFIAGLANIPNLLIPRYTCMVLEVNCPTVRVELNSVVCDLRYDPCHNPPVVGTNMSCGYDDGKCISPNDMNTARGMAIALLVLGSPGGVAIMIFLGSITYPAVYGLYFCCSCPSRPKICLDRDVEISIHEPVTIVI